MLLLVLMTAALLVAAGRLSAWSHPYGDAADRITAWMLWAWAGVVMLLELADGVSALHAWGVTALTVGVALVVVGVLPRGTPRRPLPRTWLWGPLVGIVASLAARMWGYSVAFVWDDLAYHATAPAWWVQQQALAIQPFTYQGYYPFNAELMNLWFMLPIGHDLQANAGSVLWAVGLAAAGSRIALKLGQSLAPTLAFWAMVFAAPGISGNFARFVPNDLAAGAGLLMGLAFCFVEPDARLRARHALLAGLGAGLALGTKVAVLPAAGLMGLWWLWQSVRHKEAKPVLGFAAALFATGAYWYVRNWVVTGNPLFPAEIGPFEGPFDKDAQSRSSIVSMVLAPETFQEQLGMVGYFLHRRLTWPAPMGIAAVAGLAVGAWQVWRDRLRNPRRAAWLGLMVVAMGVMLLHHPTVPFSGGNNRPVPQKMGTHRYLLPVFLIGLSMFNSLWPHRKPWATLVPPVLFALAPLMVWHLKLKPFPLGGLALGALGALIWQRWPGPSRSLVRLWPVLAVVLLADVTGKQERTDREIFTYERPNPIGKAWKALEDLPPGTRVTSFSRVRTSNLMYPMFGRRLQLVPVELAPDGTQRPLLHERWRDEEYGWWSDHHVSPTVGKQLLRALLEARVEVVLVTKWNAEPELRLWPWQRSRLEGELPADRRLYGDDYSELWDLRDLD